MSRANYPYESFIWIRRFTMNRAMNRRFMNRWKSVNPWNESSCGFTDSWIEYIMHRSMSSHLTFSPPYLIQPLNKHTYKFSHPWAVTLLVFTGLPKAIQGVGQLNVLSELNWKTNTGVESYSTLVLVGTTRGERRRAAIFWQKSQKCDF